VLLNNKLPNLTKRRKYLFERFVCGAPCPCGGNRPLHTKFYIFSIKNYLHTFVIMILFIYFYKSYNFPLYLLVNTILSLLISNY